MCGALSIYVRIFSSLSVESTCIVVKGARPLRVPEGAK